jgi:hypothetical protein
LWERHAVARVGQRPQAIINAQAVDQADIVVAFFDSRLGTETDVDVSGTAEEINRAVDQGKPVHVYFSNEPLPNDVYVQQLQALREFKGSLQDRGVLGGYDDPADLVGQVQRAVEADIADAEWADGTLAGAVAPGVELQWEHIRRREPKGTDKRGQVTYRTGRCETIYA